jgi:lambda family phage minor tail protein L
MTISTEVQKLEPDALVTLYILDTTPIGGTTIFRFTSMPGVSGNIMFGGFPYTPIDIDASGFDWDGSGSFPKPKLRVTNIGNIVSNAIVGFGDMVGAKFYRIRTFAMHLDDGSTPDSSATFPIEAFTVDQLSKHTKLYLEWTLASSIDQIGMQLPRRQCLRDTCTHRYRIYKADTDTFDYSTATCPYTGTAMFKEDETTTLVKSQDVCNKLLSGCRLRFGVNGILPTRSFPGIAKTRT